MKSQGDEDGHHEHPTVAFHPIGETLEAEPFYTKCGFTTRLSDPKEDDKTVLMFFDLKSWSER